MYGKTWLEGPARGLIRALNLGQLEHARQPGAGWCGAKVLAQVLIHRASKVFSSSADFLSADSVRTLLWYKSIIYNLN